MKRRTDETDEDAPFWRRLTLDIRPSQPWVVIELASQGTNQAGQEVRFDDVSLVAI